MSNSVSATFLARRAAWREDLRGSGDLDGALHLLEARLAALLKEARGRWPGVVVDDHAFVRYLADRVPEEARVPCALDALRAADLYLACACARGDAAALRAFRRAYEAQGRAALQRAGAEAATIDEVLQAVAAKLFVPHAGAPPGIAAYGGRGDLGSWYAVTVTREHLSARRRTHREVPLGGSPGRDLETAAAGRFADPELAFLRRRYADAFGRAFAEAVATLACQERNLLRYHYVDGLNPEAIAALYRVHRVTIARRLHALRATLVEATHARLAADLRLRVSEVGSVLRALRSEVYVSLQDALR